MATSKPRSNVAKSTQLTHFKFRWWMALVLVGVVAVIGIVILRFSHAGGNTYPDFVKYVNNNSTGTYIELQSSGVWQCPVGRSTCTRKNGFNQQANQFNLTCANITSQGYKRSAITRQSNPPGSEVTVSETFSGWTSSVCP